ncbi:AAA family ATPase [Dyadobacter arcticus]|uniref:ATP-binding protein n=1 Tax=Dyadobacter arcticus TaxID=1078754 RepID=A0ABX0UHR4_9BACT|nr:ATP-binding protein [Dyadobacter arcticus]NIJ52564.1 hypothetical protein [Dyadobacter arcticus]
MIIIVFGLPGSGKSFFASRLADKLNVKYISSDQTRKGVHALGKYSFEDKMTIYHLMAKNVDEDLNQGETVVIDATFHHDAMRAIFINLGKRRETPIRFILIQATDSITKKRLSGIRQDSEADYAVYLLIREQFEMPEIPILKLQSENDNIDRMTQKALEYLRGSYE